MKQKKNKIYNEKILSIDADDDNENYDAFCEFLIINESRTKGFFARELDEMGENYIEEVKKRKEKSEKKKPIIIKEILKKTNEYTEEELLEYELRDLKSILDEIKTQKLNTIKKIFKFFFNK